MHSNLDTHRLLKGFRRQFLLLLLQQKCITYKLRSKNKKQNKNIHLNSYLEVSKASHPAVVQLQFLVQFLLQFQHQHHKELKHITDESNMTLNAEESYKFKKKITCLHKFRHMDKYLPPGQYVVKVLKMEEQIQGIQRKILHDTMI